MTRVERFDFASDLLDTYVRNFPYLSVVEAYYDKFGENPSDEDADAIHDLITSLELLGP
jgi:hypothetical protein